MNFARTESFEVRWKDEKLWECLPFVITPALVHFEVRQRRCRWQRITHCASVIGRLIGCRSQCCHYRYHRLNIAQTRTLLWTAVCSWLPRLPPSHVANSGSSSSTVLVRHCARGRAGIVCQIKFPRTASFHAGSQMPGTTGTVLEMIEFYDSRLRLHRARMLFTSTAVSANGAMAAMNHGTSGVAFKNDSVRDAGYARAIYLNGPQSRAVRTR